MGIEVDRTGLKCSSWTWLYFMHSGVLKASGSVVKQAVRKAVLSSHSSAMNGQIGTLHIVAAA
jgi:hypothetical protein